MKLTNHRTAASVSAGITFPRLESWNSMTKMATVAVNVNKNRVLCRIPLDILKDKFGASEEEPMLSIIEYRIAIQAAAIKLIENDVYEEDGSILIRSSDL